jgi:hypothetical protein
MLSLTNLSSSFYLDLAPHITSYSISTSHCIATHLILPHTLTIHCIKTCLILSQPCIILSLSSVSFCCPFTPQHCTLHCTTSHSTLYFRIAASHITPTSHSVTLLHYSFTSVHIHLESVQISPHIYNSFITHTCKGRVSLACIFLDL